MAHDYSPLVSTIVASIRLGVSSVGGVSELTQVIVSSQQGAGKPTNQDRAVWGERWIAVLDGATSTWAVNNGQDGAWIASVMAAELALVMHQHDCQPLPDIVATAIARTCQRMEPTSTPPSTTLALARWDSQRFHAYVLGDSTVRWTTNTGTTSELTDQRLEAIGTDLRHAYRQAKHAGCPTAAEHLATLQAEERQHKNVECGYWIISDNPTAAHHGYTTEHQTADIHSVTCLTDGATTNELDDATTITCTALHTAP